MNHQWVDSDPTYADRDTAPIFLPPVPSTPENRPIFHDTHGLNATEYRMRQRRLAAMAAGEIAEEAVEEAPLEYRIRAHYRTTNSYRATSAHFGLSVYYVKQAISSASHLEVVR